MHFPDSFFEDEVRDGFFVPGLMKKTWAAQMEVLADIAKVCQKYNIRWFADRGTLLGAVRHGGYIPWDDDLDICMLRDDYIRFYSVAEKELPVGYYLPRVQGRERCLLSTVWNRTSICIEKDHLEKFHGYPYIAGVDIFPLDYIAPRPEDEKARCQLANLVGHAASTIRDDNQHTDEAEALVTEIEQVLHVTLDRGKSMQNQLFALLEKVFSLFSSENATEVAYMPNWISWKSWKFPLEYYEKSVMLPFEHTKIAVPILYREATRVQFGDHYMTPIRSGGGHDYPCYQPLEQKLAELTLGRGNLLSQYHFSRDHLHRPEWQGQNVRPGKLAADFVNIARELHQKIFEAASAGNLDTAKYLLETCQNSAIQTGTTLEQFGLKDHLSIRLLEQYCEQVYLIHENPDSIRSVHQQLDGELAHMEAIIQTELPIRKEIVFLPFKASFWNSMEPMWREASRNPDYDVYVIPIPYYYKSLDQSSGKLHYEGGLFPDYVPVTDYRQYDLRIRQPDITIIHNPYDDCSFTTSVHPSFYSSNLKNYTGQLIYIPYFQLDEIEPEDTRSIHNMKYYVTVPGVVHSDKVLVQSEQMRTAYIECLTRFAGEDTKTIWEKKIICYDKTHNVLPDYR